MILCRDVFIMKLYIWKSFFTEHGMYTVIFWSLSDAIMTLQSETAVHYVSQWSTLHCSWLSKYVCMSFSICWTYDEYVWLRLNELMHIPILHFATEIFRFHIAYYYVVASVQHVKQCYSEKKQITEALIKLNSFKDIY